MSWKEVNSEMRRMEEIVNDLETESESHHEEEEEVLEEEVDVETNVYEDPNLNNNNIYEKPEDIPPRTPSRQQIRQVKMSSTRRSKYFDLG